MTTDVPERFGDYALEEGQVIRVLIPARLGDRLVSWAELGGQTGITVDGSTEWDELTAWPASGAGPTLVPDRPVGPPSLEWALALGRALIPSSDDSGLPRALVHALRTWADTLRLPRWSGSARGLAAPDFGDSAVVSGPDGTLEWLRREGFEAHRVSRASAVPRWTD